MSVHVRHLNADSTFLLTFSLPNPTGDGTKDGTFTVLTDPWLAESGAPQIHSKFAFAARKIPAHVSHLSQIPAPNVIVISQSKSDHCHEDTLRQLPADLPKTIILAHPDAAKKIRSWKYFRPSKVHTLPTFSPKSHNGLVCFNIPVKIPGSKPGEATITLLKQPRDLTKLHNAIAITYRPPIGGIASLPGTPTEANPSQAKKGRLGEGTPNAGRPMSYQLRTMLSSPALKQHDAQFQPQIRSDLPLTPPETPPESEQDPAEGTLSPTRNFSLPIHSPRQRSRTLSSLITPPGSTISNQDLASEAAPSMSFSPPTPSTSQYSANPWTQTGSVQTLPPSSPPPTIPLPPVPDRRPLSADANFGSQSQQLSLDALASGDSFEAGIGQSSLAPPRARSICSLSALHAPKPVSVLYAPHGIEPSAVKTYAQTHLVNCAALPLTLILHPFARIDNPWWLGGNISAGTPGALEIVRSLMARNWINAHDEEKEESGLGLKMLKKGYWDQKQVNSLLEKGSCNVQDMPCGDEMTIIA